MKVVEEGGCAEESKKEVNTYLGGKWFWCYPNAWMIFMYTKKGFMVISIRYTDDNLLNQVRKLLGFNLSPKWIGLCNKMLCCNKVFT